MADILTDEAAAFAADPEFVDKANGYVVDADDWNELLAAHRAVNSFFHGGAVPSSLRMATCRVGDSSTSGGTFELNKSEAGVGNFDFRNSGTLRWRWVFAADESLALERYDSSGVISGTPMTFATGGTCTFANSVVCGSGLTISAGNQTISTGNLTLSGSAAFISLGDAATSGNAQIRFLKGGANNQSIFSIQSDAVLQWNVQHDSSENLNFQRTPSGDTSLRLRQSDGALCSLVQNALVELGTATQGTIVITTPTVPSAAGSSLTLRGSASGTSIGGPVTVIGGTPAATSTGGQVTVRGGPGGATSGTGGAASVLGGTPTEGTGGAATCSAADGVGTNQAGGQCTLRSGSGTGSGNAGDVVVFLGSSPSGTHGVLSIRPQLSTTNETRFLANGGVQFGGSAGGWRSLSANAALTLAERDRNIELNKTSGATAATMTATYAGHVVRVVITTFSAGSYTLACTRGSTSGTVTLDALGEGALLVYSGSAWKLLELIGGATFA